MNSESIKKIATQAVEQLMEALNAGHSDALARYLGAMAKFRAYSFLNVLLILRACPNACRVAGYKTWQGFGRQVKQGEKGIMILAPMFRKSSKDPCIEPGKESDEDTHISDFRAVHVWAEQQTTGKELPQIGSVTGNPSSYLERLEQFVRDSGIRLEYSPGIAPARGMAERGKITLLPNQTPAETFATLVHELAHSDLHFGKRRTNTDKRVRETEAESVAYVVCSAIGLDTGTAAQDYVTLHGGDAKLLLESLEYVQAAASRILNAIESGVHQKAA
jgi:antirestriction protein ArdC